MGTGHQRGLSVIPTANVCESGRVITSMGCAETGCEMILSGIWRSSGIRYKVLPHPVYLETVLAHIYLPALAVSISAGSNFCWRFTDTSDDLVYLFASRCFTDGLEASPEAESGVR